MTKGKSTKAQGTVTVEMALPYENATVTLTGADPNEDVVINVLRSGAGTELIEATTDGSGNATATFVGITPGIYTVWVTSPVHADIVADAVEATL
jgi:hypothetical protein